jgi:hypothetical protein
MKKYLAAALMLTAAQFVPAQVAQAQQATPPAPVEAYYCNFLPGKSMKDLMPVAERQRQWSDKNAGEYSAWILTPAFAFDVGRTMPQVIWLGSTPNGNEFGKVASAWASSGGDIQSAFDAVVDCSMGHFLASSFEINAPEGIPGDGVVMFSQCNIADGSDAMKAVEAHKKLSQDMRALGTKGSTWAFFPMLGGRDGGFDYWGVSTFNSTQDYFDAYEVYMNGGGWQKFAQHLGGITSCNDTPPTVWNVKLVRKGNSQR